MTDKEAMNLALEALMYASYEDIEYNDACAAKVLEARNALKERLAQPHETTLKEFNQQIHDDPNYHIWVKEREDVFKPEFDALQMLANDNQRMAKIIAELDAKRTWVDLTNKEREEIALEVPMDAVLITEAKLKKLNT